MKITKKRLILTCLILACLVLFGIWHNKHARFTHDKLAHLAQKHVSRVLDKIQATDDQKEQIRSAASAIKAEWTTTKAASKADYKMIFDGLLKPEIDPLHHHQALDRILDRYNRFSHAALDHLIRTATVLTPEQRTDLKYRYEKAHP